MRRTLCSILCSNQRRLGAVAPLTALLLVPLLGMMAFSIDLGYITVSQAELQGATDAAAQAGAQKLAKDFGLWMNPGSSTATKNAIKSEAIAGARNQAIAIAGQNRAGNRFVNLLPSDVEIGYYDGTTFNPVVPANRYPNYIKVTSRYDGVSNPRLGLFFARIFGQNDTALETTATVGIFTVATPTNFSTLSGVNGGFLPIAIDKPSWDQFMQGNSAHFAPSSWNTANGEPAFQVYPAPSNANQSASDRGLLNVGPPTNSAMQYKMWIDGNGDYTKAGPTASDIQWLKDNNKLPLQPTSTNEATFWKGSPGLKSTLESNFDALLVEAIDALVDGRPRLLPLYNLTNGANGQNFAYRIVDFVPVQVTYSNGRGQNMEISVQPATYVDPTMVVDYTTAIPASSGTSTSTVVVSRLLN